MKVEKRSKELGTEAKSVPLILELSWNMATPSWPLCAYDQGSFPPPSGIPEWPSNCITLVFQPHRFERNR